MPSHKRPSSEIDPDETISRTPIGADALITRFRILFSISPVLHGGARTEHGARKVIIDYARVSTHDQHLDVQEHALRAAGCEKVFADTASGKLAAQPGLDEALGKLHDGDTLVAWKLDRLGRSVKQLVDLVSGFERDGVQFRSVTDAIDTSTPAGRLFFHVMASLAEMERGLIVERTRAGLDAARRSGRLGGRKRIMTESRVESARRVLASGTAPQVVATDLGVSIATLYRWLPAKDRA